MQHAPLQPYNHSDDDEGDGGDDHDGECAEDQVLFESDSDADGGEDDSWFDEMIQRQLSDVSDVPPTEIDQDSQPVHVDSQPKEDPMLWMDSQPDTQPYMEYWDSQDVGPGPPNMVPMSEMKLPGEELESLPLKDGAGARPVARPLQATDKNIINLDEDDDEKDIAAHARAAALKARRIAALKAQIAELEKEKIQVKKLPELGPQF